MVRERRARLIHIGAPPEVSGISMSPEPVDTVPVVYAVYSAEVAPAELAGRARIRALEGRDMPGREPCGGSDTLALEVSSIARLAADSPAWLRDAGVYVREKRLDSSRHVVTLRSPARFGRGCRLEIIAPTEVGDARTTSLYVEVRRPWYVALRNRGEEGAVGCARGCRAGPLTLEFNRGVSGDALRRAVRIGGRAPDVIGNDPKFEWTVRDTIPMGRPLRLEVDAALATPSGERLGYAIDTLLVRDPSAVELGYPDGEAHVPRSASRLLRVRAAYADTVVVIIARVPDSLRGRALMHGDRELGRLALWSDLVSDSVVRVIPVESSTTAERIVDVGMSHVPRAWRADPLLLVRAVPRTRASITRVAQKGGLPRPGTGVLQLPMAEVVSARYGPPREPTFAVVQRTNLAAHVAQRGRMMVVWVTRVQSAAPVEGAHVRLFKRGRGVVASTVSDRAGLAELRMGERAYSGDGGGSHYIEVSEAADRVLIAPPQEAWMRQSDPAGSEANSTAETSPALVHATAFTDREMYRPGERVYLKGIARIDRGPAGYAVPAGDSARWVIWHYAGRRERLEVRAGQLGAFGTLVDSFQLAATARLGTYGAAFEVRTSDGWRDVANHTFRVNEDHVPEFSVTLNRDSTVRVYAGDTAVIRVTSRYRFGPPMHGGKVRAVASLSPTEDEAADMEALRDFAVGRPVWWIPRDPKVTYAQYELTDDLSPSGEAVLRFPIPSHSGPGRMTISVSVEDVNRQSISSTSFVPIRAASIQVGVRTTHRRWVWTTRDSISLDALVVGRDGGPRAGHRVTLTATRLSWQGDAWRPDTVWRTEVRPEHEPSSGTFVPTTAGWYEIVAGVQDSQGRTSESALTLYVSTRGREAVPGAARFTSRVDRGNYRAGDTAVVLIDAPQELSAVVTLRRDFLLERRALWLHRGVNEVRLPVPVAAIGGAVIDVIAARPLGAAQMADGSQSYSFRESAEIAVSDSVRALRVRLAPERPRYAPGDTVRATVRVLEPTGRGRRSEVAVWAVDAGALTLGAYKTPAVLAELLFRPYSWERSASTLQAFLRVKPPSVGPVCFPRYQRRSLHAAAATASGSTEGFNASAGRSLLRNGFVTTQFYAGNVITDTAGHASVSFVLPGNATTYRLFAVAVSDGTWAGATDTMIVSTREPVGRSALPRVSPSR